MKKSMDKKLADGKHLLIYSLSQGVESQGKLIQLLPYGLVSTVKGNFLVDEVALSEIMANFEVRVNDIVIDYEHQTLTGEEAPAAGWIKNLENRGPEGLWAEVEWTPRAEGYIQNKEYRYLSPVVFVRKSDNRAVYLHSAALTNDPAIDGMQPLAAKFGITNQETEEKSIMDFLKKLALKLGLKETATEDEVQQAVVNLQTPTQIVANKEILSQLGLDEKATLEEAKSKLVALKNQPQTVANKEILTLLDLPETASLDETKGKIISLKNPSGYVKVEDFTALKQKLDLRDRDELVAQALGSGKVAPAQKEWAEQYALKDPAGFKAFLEKAPQVVPLNQLSAGDPPARETVPDEVQMSVNKALGVSDEDFKKHQKD